VRVALRRCTYDSHAKSNGVLNYRFSSDATWRDWDLSSGINQGGWYVLDTTADQGPPGYFGLQTTSSDGLCFDRIYVDGVQVGDDFTQWLDAPCTAASYSSFPCSASYAWSSLSRSVPEQAVEVALHRCDVPHSGSNGVLNYRFSSDAAWQDWVLSSGWKDGWYVLDTWLDHFPPKYLDLKTTSTDGLCFDRILVDGSEVGEESPQWLDAPCDGGYNSYPCSTSLNWIIRESIVAADSVPAAPPSPPIVHPPPLHLVMFRSHHNKFIVAETDGRLNANRPWIGTWEIFEAVDNGDGTTSFKSHHGKYWSAKADGSLYADAASIGDAEKFKLFYNPDGTVSFQSNYRQYVVAEENGDCNANRNTISDYNKFTLVTSGHMAVAFQSQATNKFLVAEGNGHLNANRKGMGAWEKFDVVEYGDGDTMSLRSHHVKYVSARPDGDLHANADRANTWETFRETDNDDGSVSLQSYHQKFVTAEADGGATANANTIGAHEKWHEILVES